MVLWLCLGNAAAAEEISVTFLLSSNAEHYRAVSEGLKARLRERRRDIAVATRLPGELPKPQEGELVVTLGTRATTEFLEAYPAAPQLGLFITESSWAAHRPIQDGGSDPAPKAAIFVDQPVQRYVMLAVALAPGARTLGTALGPHSRRYRDQLRAAANRHGKSLVTAQILRDDNPLHKLTPVLDKSDIFIAVPDQSLFNRTIARWALQLGFERHIPVIGFSRSYTRAGAVASVFTSPTDVIRQGGEWLNRYLDSRQPRWGGQPPAYYSLQFNRSVASALGRQADDLRRVVERMERLVREEAP